MSDKFLAMLEIDDQTVEHFRQFKSGELGEEWLSFGLTGPLGTTVELVSSGVFGGSFTDFQAAALPMEEGRYCLLRYRSKDGNGGEPKLMFVLWTPDSCSVRAKMLFAASKMVMKLKLAMGDTIDLQAEKHDELTLDTLDHACSAPPKDAAAIRSGGQAVQ